MRSREDSSLHGQLEDFVTLLEHLVLERPVVHGQLSILQDKLLHNVAVVGVDGKDLGEADEYFVLHPILRVDERRQFLREVDRLIHGDLGSLLLVLLEEEGEGVNYLRPGGPVGEQLRALLQHRVIFAQLGQEVVQGFDGASTKHFVKDRDFLQELASDFLEASGQFGHIGQRYLEVIS